MKCMNFVRFYFSSHYWKTHWKPISLTFFGLLGATWTAIELTNYFSGKDNFVPRSIETFGLISVVAAILSLIANFQKLTFHYRIKSKDINITLVIGDLFEQKADIVLSTNTTFDTTTENRFISKDSIQGQLYRYYSKPEHLDSDLDRALAGIEPKEILNRSKSKSKRYEFGTIAKLDHNSFMSYWVAMADVSEVGKPTSSFEIFQVCLEKLWTYILTSGHMDRLAMPILGSGKTGINENRTKLLKEIIFSFVAFSREKKITEELIICVHPSDFFSHGIDIDHINKFLEYSCLFTLAANGNGKQSIGIDI